MLPHQTSSYHTQTHLFSPTCATLGPSVLSWSQSLMLCSTFPKIYLPQSLEEVLQVDLTLPFLNKRIEAVFIFLELNGAPALLLEDFLRVMSLRRQILGIFTSPPV